MSKKLNIAERFELAVPADPDTGWIPKLQAPIQEDHGFPEPVVRAKATRPRDVTREHGILNYPTHHAANLSALCRLYNLSPTAGV